MLTKNVNSKNDPPKWPEDSANRQKTHHQALLTCAQKLVGRDPSQESLRHVLQELLKAIQLDRAYLMENFTEPGGQLYVRIQNEVCLSGVNPQIDHRALKRFPYQKISPHCRTTLANGQPYGGVVRKLLPAERRFHQDQDIRSFMLIPIQVEDHWWGCLGMDACRHEHSWQPEDIELLGSAAELIGAYLARLEIDKRLQQSEKKLRTLTDNTLDSIWLMDMDLTFRYINNAVMHTFGYSPEEWIGSNLADHCSKEELEKMSVILLRALEHPDQHPGVLFETVLHRKDGEPVPVEILAKFSFDEKHQIVGLQGTTRDVRERIASDKQRAQLEAQVRQLVKMEALGTLAGGVAHDFNNILSAIIGYAELALFDVPQGSRLAVNLEGVLGAGKRATDLVKQILTFSRRSEHQRSPIQMQIFVKEALKLMRSSLPSTIEIRGKISQDLPNVLGDPTQIHQIVMNLCTNAAHAMAGEGGVLEVLLEKISLGTRFINRYPELAPGTYLKLTVRDTGHGMSPEIMESIFDPYFTTKKVGEGTGMGLAVVHGIVKSYGGEITVQSQPNEGTTFEIYLPTLEGEVFTAGEETTYLPTGKERILLVDDEPALVIVGKQRLERLGYLVETRSDSLEALAVVRKDPQHFDLVITDMTMPKMTGDKLAAALLRIRSNLPIILCTGFSQKINKERAQKIGIKAFLMKPLELQNLASTVRRVLDGTL
jgi:PAS domain S-box-containing protein